jgi:hypothetical protein
VTPESLRGNLAFLASALKGSPTAPPSDVAAFARAHTVVEILDACAGPALPSWAREAFHGAREAQAKRSARLLSVLEGILGAFREAKVPALLLKGLGLGQRYYGGLDRRATRDLDLLVRETDLPKAEGALRRLGFRRASIVPSRPLALRFTHAFDYVREGTTVDLHWAIARHPSFHIDSEGLRGRAQTLRLGDVDVLVPSDEDALALCALAIFRDLQRGALRARALVDLYRIAKACPALDVPSFLARRKSEGTDRITVAMFRLLLLCLDARDTLPAISAAVEGAPQVPRDRERALLLLLPGPFAFSNRLLAIRLYACPWTTSFLWWLVSLPVRILAYRSWRLPSRRRRRG